MSFAERHITKMKTAKITPANITSITHQSLESPLPLENGLILDVYFVLF